MRNVGRGAINPIGGGITAPDGFRAAGIACGIKASGKPDLALIAADEPEVGEFLRAEVGLDD